MTTIRQRLRRNLVIDPRVIYPEVKRKDMSSFDGKAITGNFFHVIPTLDEVSYIQLLDRDDKFAPEKGDGLLIRASALI